MTLADMGWALKGFGWEILRNEPQLRHAAGLANAASQQGFSSEKAVNDIRAEASIALKGVVGSLDVEQHPLTETMIDRAKTAVANWLAALGAESH